MVIADDRPALPPSTLIIPSRNRPTFLYETIVSILEGQAIPTEIIIIDQSDAPDARLREMATERPCRLRYHWTTERGLSRGRNEGIRLATTGIIAFADDDMFMAADWYATLIGAVVEAGPRVVVTGRVLGTRPATRGGFVPSLMVSEEPASYHGRLMTDPLAGGHMAAYRSAFEEIGLFDERLGAGTRLPGAEDNDWNFRLLEANYELRYVPRAVMYHRAWRTRRDLLPLYYGYGKGQGGFYAKHLGQHGRHMTRRVTSDIITRLVNFPYRLIVARWRAAGDTAYCFGLLAGMLTWWLARPAGAPGEALPPPAPVSQRSAGCG